MDLGAGEDSHLGHWLPERCVAPWGLVGLLGWGSFGPLGLPLPLLSLSLSLKR